MALPNGYGYPGGYPSQPSPAPYGAGFPGATGATGAPGGPGGQSPTASPNQRPGVIAAATSLSVTASMMWMVLLAFGWLTAYSVQASFDSSDQVEGALFHVAERFQLSMTAGLAFPLFGFPLAAVVAGFLLLARRSWARIAFSGLGVLSLGWSAWWLHRDLGWWLPLLAYIGLASALPWLASVGRWYAGTPNPSQRSSTQFGVPGGHGTTGPGLPNPLTAPPAQPTNAPYGVPYGQYRP